MTYEEVPQSDLPDSTQTLEPQEVPAEDIPQGLGASGSEVPQSDLPTEVLQDKYSSPGQKILTGIESVARGATAGLSDTLASGMRKGASDLGVPDDYLHYIAPSPEDISGRKEANPIESGTGEFTGNIGLMGALPQAKVKALGQIGSKALNGMIQMGIIGAGDELSKAMLGQGDPTPAVASHIALNGALGLFGGALFGKAEQFGTKGLQSLENQKMGSKLSSIITGAGHAAHFPGEETVSLADSALSSEEAKGIDNKSFKLGQDIYNSYLGQAPKYAARVAAPIVGEHLGGLGGAAASMALEQAIEHIAPKVSQKLIAPALMKAAGSGAVENVAQVLDHATKVGKGAQKISRGIEAIFGAGSNKAIDYEISESQREKLRDFIEKGGIDQRLREQLPIQDQPQFAEGGKVPAMEELNAPNAVERLWPEQNVLLNTAKARVSNYLNSVRPLPSATKLPYDTERKDPKKDRDYDKTLDLAAQPLKVLEHIKNGTLLPRHMSALTSMYPELHQELSKKITERIAQGHMKNEKKPIQRVRQSLSLFLGSNMESAMTPASIMAAQNVFAQQNAKNQSPPNSKASLSKLGPMSQTPEQAREQALNKA